MLTLSLVLGAAAGVNAILGGEVVGVKVAEGEYVCANDCAYKGVFLGQTGFYCPMEEVVHRVTSDGADDFSFRFQCAGDQLPEGYTERPRRAGEEPKNCYSTDLEFDCLSDRGNGGPQHPKTIEWSDLAESLEKANAEDAQTSPAPEKPVDCAAEGSNVFYKCQEETNPSFDKCYQRAREAIETCRQK